jgi:hypothetical protein
LPKRLKEETERAYSGREEWVERASEREGEERRRWEEGEEDRRPSFQNPIVIG